MYLENPEISDDRQHFQYECDANGMSLNDGDVIITECYFIRNSKTTSATICANCGKEKWLHTIGEGVRVTKIIFNR